VDDREVDCRAFTALAAEGNRELRDGRHDRAATALAEGLRLWRGSLGEGLPDTAPLRERFEDLNRVRQLARVDLCEARLRLAEAPLIVNDLYQLSAESPLAERPVALLMEALSSLGNPAGALTEYHRFRRTLGDETGTGPGLELQALYRGLLRRDEDRGGQARPARLRRDWSFRVA
jgi:DNA-binding SARP family transcriptional activator